MDFFFIQLLLATLFLTTILFHMVRNNTTAILVYAVQSAVISALLFSGFLHETSAMLLTVILATFFLKVVIAPRFFIGLVHKHTLTFSASTYLNTPITLIAISILSAVAHSSVFLPLGILAPGHERLLFLALSAVFISFFLMINRKGIVSQMLGILSLENSIVAFAFLAGLEQSPNVQAGILFDIAVWIGIATAFTSMTYKHFGSLDGTIMDTLKD